MRASLCSYNCSLERILLTWSIIMLASSWNPSPSVSLQKVTLWRASVCSRGITVYLLSRWPRACSTFGSWRVCHALSPRLLCCPTRPSTCVSSRSRDCQVTLLVFGCVCSGICAAVVCVWQRKPPPVSHLKHSSWMPELPLRARMPSPYTQRECERVCVCVCEVTK